MEKGNLNLILRVVYLFVPILIFIFLFCPVVKVKATAKTTVVVGQTIQTETVSDKKGVSGFGLIGGIFVGKNYKGSNDNLKVLSSVKAMGDEKGVKGGRTVVLNGFIALAVLFSSIALIWINVAKFLDIKNQKFNKVKNFSIKHQKYAEWTLGISSLLMFIFSFMLSTWKYRLSIFGATTSFRMCSYIAFCGVLIFLLGVGYLVSKIILTKKKIFSEEELLSDTDTPSPKTVPPSENPN